VYIKLLKTLLQLTSLLIIVTSLSSCKNTSVYGSVGVGYNSQGFNNHHSSTRMRGSISIGGRIR